MLLRDTKSSVRPCAVLLDEKENGWKIVRMAGNIREEIEEGQVLYVYDEALFELEAEREETAEDIEADFESWWEYGTQEEEPLLTLEERVAMLEDYIISGGEI